MNEIKLDLTSLPEDQQEVVFIPESTEEHTKGTYVSGDMVFVDDGNHVHRAWDVISWCDAGDYTPQSFCCGGDIIGETGICSVCKEHC